MLVPTITVLELRDGTYLAVASGTEAVDRVAPFPVRLVPSDLVV